MLIHTFAHRILCLTHAENERSESRTPRGVAYALTFGQRPVEFDWIPLLRTKHVSHRINNESERDAGAALSPKLSAA
jgi:hypothetical protein